MTDLQLSVLLEQIGNRLDAELRFLKNALERAITCGMVDKDVLGPVWNVRADLYDEVHRLSGTNLPPFTPEL